MAAFAKGATPVAPANLVPFIVPMTCPAGGIRDFLSNARGYGQDAARPACDVGPSISCSDRCRAARRS
jgi:hypothetical protein